MATAGYDNRVILWNGESKVGVARGMHDHLANQCGFSACGRYLVSASSDHTARIWSVPSMKLVAFCSGHDDDVEMAAFSPDGERVATASRDATIRIFRRTGECERVLRGHEADVLSVAWSADGRSLISSSDDGTVKTWDWAAGEIVADHDMGGCEVDTLAFGNDGEIFAGDDKGWLTMLHGSRRSVIEAHAAGIKRVVCDPTSRSIVSISYDRTASFWQFGEDGELVRDATIDLPDIVWPRSCAFLSRDRVAFATFGTSYAVCDRTRGQFETTGIERTWGFNAVACRGQDTFAIGDAGVLFCNGRKGTDLGTLCNFLAGFGALLVTGGQAGILFDALTGTVLHRHRSPLNCAIQCSAEGKEYLAVGAYTGEILVFRAAGPQAIELVHSIAAHDNAVKGLACSGGTLFSVCATGDAAFHNSRTFQQKRLVPGAHGKIANGCVALDDGSFASVSRDRALRIWRDGESRRIATPHTHSIKCIAVYGSRIATGAYNGRLAIYDLGSACWIFDRQLSESGLSSVCATPDGFVAAAYDGKLHRVAA